jgi:hypothetical protein
VNEAELWGNSASRHVSTAVYQIRLEVLYKELMELMMNAQTSSVHSPHLSELQGIERQSGLQYLMSADDLSLFEAD